MWDTNIAWEDEGRALVLYRFTDDKCERVGDVYRGTYWWEWRLTGDDPNSCYHADRTSSRKIEAVLGLLRNAVPNLDDVLGALQAAALAGDQKTVLSLSREYGIPACTKCGAASDDLRREYGEILCWKCRHY